MQIHWNCARFLPSFQGRWLSFDKEGTAGDDALCSVFAAAVKTEESDKKELPVSHANVVHGETELLMRRSYPTRHAFTTAVKTELSDEKKLPESHAHGAHGETEVPDEKELPDETEPPDKNG